MKRTVSILVGLILVCVFLGCYGFTEAYASGSVKASFDKKTGTMTISGNGDMPKDMVFSGDESIKKVVIKEGVTSVCRNAFSGCSNIKSIELPEGLLSLGTYCFLGTNIKRITIPSTVKDIGQSALWGCKRLKWITMPGDFTLHYDEYNADESIFRILSTYYTGSYAPKKITFNTPLDIKNVSALSAKYLVVSEDDPLYKSVNGVIYSKDGTALVRIPSERTKFKVPQGVTKIYVNAFNYYYYCEEYEPCSKLRKLYLPKGKCEIVFDKFNDDDQPVYSEMKYVQIVAKGTELDGKTIEKLAHFFNMGFGTNWIEDKEESKAWFLNGFEGLVSLDENDCLVSNDGLIIQYLGNGGEVKLDEGIKGIGAYAFFDSDVTKINLPASVKYIGDYAFGHSKLKKITIPITVEEFGADIFASSKLNTITFDEGIERIPDRICYHCTDLKKVNFPSTVKEIGDAAFNSCVSLDIDKFSGFEGLDNLTTIGMGAFYNCKMKKFVIPERVTSVGNIAFYNDLQNSKESEVVVLGDTKDYDDSFYGEKVTATFEKGLEYAKFGLWWMMHYNEPDDNGNMIVMSTWEKVNGVDGYELEGSVYEDFSNSVKVETAENEARLTIKAGKKKVEALYTRVRAFKNLDDKGNREYSGWMVLKLETMK